MQLYTFILGFRGGTYIFQRKGADVEAATRKWLEKLNASSTAHLDEDGLKLIRQKSDELGIAEISSIENVWCDTFLIEEHLAIVNIIKTEKS